MAKTAEVKKDAPAKEAPAKKEVPIGVKLANINAKNDKMIHDALGHEEDITFKDIFDN